MISDRVTFRATNLLATVLPPGPPAPPGGTFGVPCISGSCCGPPSTLGCVFSTMQPRSDGLTGDTLRSIIRDLRTKLDAETKGIDVICSPTTDAQHSEWQRVLRDELGEPWSGGTGPRV